VAADDITEERREALLAALEQERRGYLMRDRGDRVHLVDAEITRLGGGASPDAVKRPRRREKD
jgi:hypothetical protein